MSERGVSENELLMWIERAGDAAGLEDIGRRLALDPELELWARGARTDREAVMALGRAEAADAPSGLWREAVAEAERRALLIEEDIVPVRGPYKFRVTPVRLVAAAAFLIVASLGSIAPFLIGTGGGSSAGPIGDGSGGVVLGDEFEMRESLRGTEELASRTLADSFPVQEAATAPPRALLAAGGSQWAADANGIVANRALAGFGQFNTNVLEPVERVLPGAFPQRWGMSLGEAQRVADDGRLVVHVRADDVDGYIERLLAAFGRRGVVVDSGLKADLNGIGSPVELRLTVPAGKVQRALRVCAIEADDLRLTSERETGRPGAWAAERLWWAGDGGGEPSVRVLVSSR